MLLKAMKNISSPAPEPKGRTIFLFTPVKYGITAWGRNVTFNYKTWTFHFYETHFKREGLKEVTEMRSKKKRGRSSDKYWVLVQADRETRKICLPDT